MLPALAELYGVTADDILAGEPVRPGSGGGRVEQYLARRGELRWRIGFSAAALFLLAAIVFQGYVWSWLLAAGGAAAIWIGWGRCGGEEIRRRLVLLLPWAVGLVWYVQPQVGDFIFFRTSRYRYAHVGRVVAVDSAKVYTIEGNTSGDGGVVANGGGVFRKSYSLGSWNIVGYGRPKWKDGERDAPAEEKEAEKMLDMQVRMLKRGMEGADVKTLQAALIAYGFSCGASGADGDFGSGTEAALKKFQTRYALGADGIAGNGTWGKLLGE